MTESPEQLRRPFGSYDPTEPMVIPYGDLIAARNAVAHLATILGRDPDPEDDFEHRSAMLGLRIGVTPDGEPHAFESFAETHQWLLGLRDRLTRLLPSPPSGPMN